jgi:hypothetical protein
VRVDLRLTYVAESASWGHRTYYTERDIDPSPTLKCSQRLGIYFFCVSNSSRRFFCHDDSS